jgi:penicillin amidase
LGTGSVWRGFFRRWVGRFVLGLCGVVVLAVGIRHLALRREVLAAHPVESGRLAVSGAHAPLAILRDRAGVPHVRAGSEHDAYFGLGFAHAQDRPAQLVWLRRAARGRLAEVEGSDALPADREARVLGLARLADRAVARISPDARGILDAYAAGVNAGFTHWTTTPKLPLPPAVADLGGPGEPWRAADSLAVAKLHAWAVGGTLDETLVLSDLIQQFGGFDSAIFFPERTGMRGIPDPGEAPQEASHDARGLRGAGTERLRRRLGLLGASIGSSAWVVSGARSRSGRPVLAADSHFEPTVPASLYAAHLEGGALDVAGAGPPGVPIFWTGFTPAVAWASVQAGVVVTDLTVESLSQRAPPRYHDGTTWRPLDVRRERIAVSGDDAETVEVSETRHGPLVNPLLAGDRPPLAVRWTGSEPGAGPTAFFAMARARSVGEMRSALAMHQEPVLAVALCDRAGDAAVQLAGAIPDRGLPTSLLPVPGRDPDYEWRGRIAAERLPARVVGPDAPFAVIADGALGRADGGAPIEWLWRPGERAERLEALLAEETRRGGVELRTMTALQRDVRSARADAMIRQALALLGDTRLGPPEREIVELLNGWDRTSTAESRGAAAYQVFVERMLRAFFEPRLGEELLARYLALGRVRAADLVAQVLAEASAGGGSTWSEPAAVREAVRTSLGGTWLQLSSEMGLIREKWSWGRLHPLRFRALGTGRVLGSELGPFPYAGDGASVQVADHWPLESFDVRTVSSFRFAIDAAALDEALASLAPGESEHPGHPHRADALVRWIPGKPTLLATSRLVVEETAVAELLLEPAAAPSPR